MNRHGGAVEIDEESRRFTPSPIDRNACLARTWNNGLGGQCTRQQAGPSIVLCAAHLRQEESERGLAHGRVDGPVPGPKLCEFLRGHQMELPPETQIMHRRGPGPEPWRGQRRPGGFGEESWMEPPAKRRPPAPAEWLAVDGSVIENAEPSGRNRVGWSSSDLWAQALPRLRDRGERSGRFLGDVDRKDPWVLGVASAMVRVEAVRSRESRNFGDVPGSLAVASQSVSALRKGMERWFYALLAELLGLSSHRFCLSDGSDVGEECLHKFDFDLPANLLAEAEAFAEGVDGDPPTGRVQASKDTEARARKIWFDALHLRQHLRRIGPTDLKALMSRPRATVALAPPLPPENDSGVVGTGSCGALRVPEVAHSHFVRLLAQEDLGEECWAVQKFRG